MLNSILSALLWISGLTHFVLVAAVALPILAVLPARKVFPLAQWLCRNQLRMMGCRLDVIGLDNAPPDRSCLYLGNHESLFDVFAVAAAAPNFAVGLEAAGHFRIPLWGHITRTWGNLPLPEGRLSEAFETFDKAADALAAGIDVIILPEGHRSRTGDLGELKKGAFHLARATKADIIPFVLDGLYEFHNTHSWRLYPRKLRVIYGQPIPYASFEDSSIEELCQRVRRALLDLGA